MTAQIISALPIPFAKDGSIQWDSYEALLERIAPHVHGALVAGTTGEFPALDDEERLEAFHRAAVVLGAERVIAHIGHASALQVIRLGEGVRELGIKDVATLNPYYLPADDDAVYEFYRDVTSSLPDLNHYVYLFPERTGITVSADAFRRVMTLPGVVGVKLSGAASEDLGYYSEHLQLGQKLYSGNDATLPLVLRSGGAGVVSGVSAAFPETFGRLSRALDGVDGEPGVEAQKIQADVEELVRLAGPSIIRLKTAVAANVDGQWESRMAMAALDLQLRDHLLVAAASHS